MARHLRVAFEVTDAARHTDRLLDAGADLIAPPTHIPWGSLSSRIDAPGGLQLTLFEALLPESMA